MGRFPQFAKGRLLHFPKLPPVNGGDGIKLRGGAQLLAEFCGTERSEVYNDFFPALFAAAHRLRAASANLARPTARIFLLALVVVLAVRVRVSKDGSFTLALRA